jgi:hypothetical protein
MKLVFLDVINWDYEYRQSPATKYGRIPPAVADATC